MERPLEHVVIKHGSGALLERQNTKAIEGQHPQAGNGRTGPPGELRAVDLVHAVLGDQDIKGDGHEMGVASRPLHTGETVCP